MPQAAPKAKRVNTDSAATTTPPATPHAEFAPYWHPSPPWGCWNYLRTAVCAVTLLPLRVILVLLLIVVFYVVGAMCTMCMHHDKPLARWRQCVLRVWGKATARACLFVLGFYYIPVTGRRDPRFHTIVSNHLSFMDIVVYMSVCFPSFVAKAGVLSVPLVGRLSRSFQCLYVSKHTDPTAPSATQAIGTRQRDMDKTPDMYAPLLIFAEGTTTNGTYVGRFRTGSFRAGYPVQPAVVKFAGRHFVPTWESIPLPVYLFRLLTQFSNHASVKFLPGFTPSAEERQEPRLYADRVRVAVAQGAGLPCCEAQLDSKWRMHKVIGAGRLHWKWYRNAGVPDPRKRLPSAVAQAAASACVRPQARASAVDAEASANGGDGDGGDGDRVMRWESVDPELSGAGTPRATFWPHNGSEAAVEA